MAKLAIKGHETRGTEVIALLEMLGGINVNNLYGDDTYDYYTITDNKEIDAVIFIYNDDETCIFTLEAFLEKFPYKVGDKVIDTKTDRVVEIYKAHWSETNNHTYYDVKCFDNTGYVRSHIFLQPHKEEIMEDNIIDVVKENDNRYRIILNYQYDMEVDEGEYYAVRRKPQYQKTYEECCEVLSLGEDGRLWTEGYKASLIQDFQKLLICRDAYWLLAGEQRGLGKPWKPDWKDDSDKYFICYLKDELWMSNIRDCNRLLVFPTTEMRDAFLENFKDLIEECKELL